MGRTYPVSKSVLQFSSTALLRVLSLHSLAFSLPPHPPSLSNAPAALGRRVPGETRSDFALCMHMLHSVGAAIVPSSILKLNRGQR